MMPTAFGILVAMFGGMAVGVERQWSGHATGPRARFAGIRTFTMLGGLGGISGSLWASGDRAPAMVLLSACCLLVVLAYAVASRDDIDATTEVSALVVLAAGVIAGMGQVTMASAIIALTGFFLIEKTRLHALVARLDDEGLRAAGRFAVMAVVIFPLLPAGPFGPWQAVRPRELWMLVLLCSGLSFAAYAARRMVGERHGYPIAGLFGGLISSTSVTLTFARVSRHAAPLQGALAFGVVAACTVLLVRVAITALLLNPPVALALAGYLVVPLAVGIVLLAFGYGHLAATGHPEGLPRNPLDFWPALQMAALFQVVLFGVAFVKQGWGASGVMASGVVLGLTDMDALTIAMARGVSTGIPVDVAARAIAVGILSNTMMKLSLALFVGVARFRQLVVPALAAMALAVATTLVLYR